MFKWIWHRLRLLAYSWRTLGPRRLLAAGPRWACDPEARNVDSGFDARFGTDTNAELTPAEAGIPAARRADATMYLPTMDEDLEAMLDALPWSEALRRQATFVDLGSGKGRVVLLAAMRRFRQIVGVELSPVLHEVAQRNLAIAEDALVSPARVVHADATAYELPDGPLIVFLYHPFREAIAQEVIDRLVRAAHRDARPIAILYGHPTLQDPLDPRVFERGSVFRAEAEGGRETRRFTIGWSVWTNRSWLRRRRAFATLRLTPA